jgi:membrane associated rhomboid family serine protease
VTPWVLRLIVANVIVFFIQQGNPGLVQNLVLVPALIPTHPWTVVTYMFLHGGPTHLLFNMLGLYFFGPRLELVIGGTRFLTLYFASGIAGALLSLFTPTVGIVGASGAIFGVFYGYAHYWPRDRILVWGIVPVEARLFVLLMTVISLGFGLGPQGLAGNTAHFAHLGGFVGGFLYFKWLERHSGAAQFRRRAEPAAPHGTSADVERWARIPREALHPVNREELDRVLAKLAEGGPVGLTPEERAFLDRFSSASR